MYICRSWSWVKCCGGVRVDKYVNKQYTRLFCLVQFILYLPMLICALSQYPHFLPDVYDKTTFAFQSSWGSHLFLLVSSQFLSSWVNEFSKTSQEVRAVWKQKIEIVSIYTDRLIEINMQDDTIFIICSEWYANMQINIFRFESFFFGYRPSLWVQYVLSNVY